jgi:hypothetical protein
MTKTVKSITSGVALLVVAACLAGARGTARADDAPQGVPHQVRYTITAQQPVDTDVWYMQNEPYDFSAYSWYSWKYVDELRVDIKPGAPWVYDSTLYDPSMWAMVTASAYSPHDPKYHCEITVDGAVVAAKDGDHGVLCSIRPWGG